jgi:SsrA-binding protein
MVIRNRKAQHDYELLEDFEAGIVLTGSEVKSLRSGGGSIAEAFARYVNGELFLEGMHIPPYRQASYNNHEPIRRRKLLLNKVELRRIRKALERQGLTLVPTRLHFKNGWAKVQLAIGRGRKNYDKRQKEADRDAQRQIDRELKRSR